MSAVDLCVFALPMHPRDTFFTCEVHAYEKSKRAKKELFFLRAFF